MLARINKNKFISNVLVVLMGSAGAQAITMAFIPLITRLYGPEEFGLLGAFMAIITIVIPVSAFTYPIAIVLPKSDEEAFGLARLSLIIALSMFSLLFIVIMINADAIAEVLNIQSISSFLLLIPFAMLFSAFHQVFEQLLIRKKQFRITARIMVIQSLLLNLSKLGIGWFHPVASVLITLATISSALHALLLWMGIKKQSRVSVEKFGKDDCINSDTECLTIKNLAFNYRDFPLFRAPQITINALSQGIPILLLASFFGPMAAGFYTLAKSVMGLPSILMGKAVSDVFYPRINEAANNGEHLHRYILKATAALFAIGLLPFGIIILFGPVLFSLAFGDSWEKAGEYAQWLALFFLFNFINKPSVVAVPVLKIQRGLLVYELISTGGKLTGLFLGFYWFSSDIWAVALFSGIGAFTYVVMISWILLSAMKWKKYEKAS